MMLLFLSLATVLVAAEPTASIRGAALVAPVRVTAASTGQPVVSIDAGGDAGLNTGDRLFVLAEDGRVVAGELIAVAAAESGAQITEAIPRGEIARAAVLRAGGLASFCRYLPLDAVIVGRVARLVPGRTTAWIDMGRQSGLQVNDHVLVRRATQLEGREIAVPIARGQILQIDEQTALISLQPLVGNAVTETGDSVELWPTPGLARIGRVNSAVLAVRSDREGDILTVVGSAADGFTEGRLLDIYRGSRFIGVASVSESGPRPLSRARMINSESLEPAREADTAILRAPAGPPPAPLLAPIFRVQGDYVLVAAGDVDGLQRDEKLRVYRQDPDTSVFTPAWEITIEKVNIDFAGGFARPLDASGAPIRVWELAERRQPPWPRWRAAGIVTRVEPAARTVTADVDPGSTVGPGDVIELAPEGDRRPCAAVVLWRLPDRLTAMIPPGWGGMEGLASAQVLVPQPRGASPAASRAAP